MNRREFVRSVGKFLVAIPLFVNDYEQGAKEALQDNEFTELTLINDNSKSEVIRYTIAPIHCNCKCRLQWIDQE